MDMRNRLGLGLATALLLVGAGCTNAPASQEEGMVKEEQAEQATGTQEETGTPAVKATGDIDADVNVIIQGADQEGASALELESDASDMTGDSSGLDTLINSSYEVK